MDEKSFNTNLTEFQKHISLQFFFFKSQRIKTSEEDSA